MIAEIVTDICSTDRSRWAGDGVWDVT